jgi:hypothetical protein
MSKVITWVVSALDCYPRSQGNADVVINVHWSCNGTQEQDEIVYNASVYSTCAVAYSGSEPFVPYDQLTEQTVLGWIWANGVDQAATEAAVQQQLNNQINPPVVTPPLPWSQA